MYRRKKTSPGLEFVVNVKPDDASKHKLTTDFTELPLESVVGQLLKTHEEECRRISREIHDDLGGRLTEMALLIQQIRKMSSVLPKAIGSELDQLQEKATQTSKAVSNFAHRLHSPVLEFTGITVSLQSLCREFQAHTGIRVDFVAGLKLADIPRDIAHCLYRITQESLSNIGKHSGSKTAKVELTSTADEAQVTIHDFGHGFTSRNKRNRGLGLISMEERVRLLQGTLQIQTQQGVGTVVRATLPLTPRKELPISQAKRAAGRG